MLSCILATAISFWRSMENDIAFGPSILLGANCEFGCNHSNARLIQLFFLSPEFCLSSSSAPLSLGRLVPIVTLSAAGAAISLLVMRTFSKVVQRHEREAILQSPSAYGGPLLSRNDFGPNIAAIAIARRRRDALALARNESSVPASQSLPSRRRKVARRTSWDYITSPGYNQSLFEDNASLKRREGLRAWDREKEHERQRQELKDPFADVHDIAEVDIFHGRDGGIDRRKSGEGPFGAEEMMLDSESIHQAMLLQEPKISSPWGDNPFAYVDYGIRAINDTSVSDGERDSIHSGRRGSISPFETWAGLGRRGSAVSGSSNEDRERPRFLQPFSASVNTNAKPGQAGPTLGSGTRRGATVGQETCVSPNTPKPIIVPSPSPPQSRNGSSIELLEQTSRTKT
jgi:hypothetical protein